jgi:uncharacterized protein YgiM (DUF1202 family)
MGKITLFGRIIGIVIVMLALGFTGCKNTDMMVVAEEPTKVFRGYPDSGPPKQDEVVAVLDKGESGTVIHSRHSKDFMYYKIRLKDGREGYVWVGDKFRVEKK